MKHQTKLEAKLVAFQKHFGYRIMTKIRTPKVAKVRWLVFTILRENGLSYPDIGILFNKDHTTVLHGVRKLKELGEHHIPESNRMRAWFKGDAEIYEQSPIKKAHSKWKAVYEAKGYACEICGFNDAIEIHHKEPLLGDRMSNLMVLCPNHHRMLHMGKLWIKENINK